MSHVVSTTEGPYIPVLNKRDLSSLIMLIDMDEVLTDFIGAACHIHGTTKVELETKRTPGDWFIWSYMGLNKNTFWEPIHKAGEDFWANLEPTPWGKRLIEMVETVGYEWHIISAPSVHETCYSGKIKWLRKHFGSSFDRFILTPHKYLFARSNHVLIDDRDANINDFVWAGGTGILFPHHGNSLYQLSANPLDFIAQHPFFKPFGT